MDCCIADVACVVNPFLNCAAGRTVTVPGEVKTSVEKWVWEGETNQERRI